MPANRPNLRPPAGGLLIANPPAPRTPAPGLPLLRRPAPRRLLATIALAVLLIAAAVPAVSAEEFVENRYTVWAQKSGTATGWQTFSPIQQIWIKDIGVYPALESVTLIYPYVVATDNDNISGQAPFIAKIGSNEVGRGTLTYNKNYNSLGTYISTIISADFDEWNPKTYSGTQTLSLTIDTSNGFKLNLGSYFYSQPAFTHPQATMFKGGGMYVAGAMSSYGYYEWATSINYNDGFAAINRYGYPSYIRISDTTIPEIDYYAKLETSDISVNCMMAPSIDVQIISPQGNIYNRVYTTGGEVGQPDTGSITVYIQSSQTGALLANAHVSISAAAGDPVDYYEVVNATLPGGTGTYQLQPTGGGSPNPDYYRAVATVPGYTQIVENHSFTLNGPHDVIIEMRPDTGGPLDPNLSYLEFYVRDIHANPISSASVQCDGRIKQTNSQGYAVFEVSKNSTYPYTAKKTNYMTIQGTATVADGPRYVANVVLGPGTVPTYTPTIGPGETPGGPGATPTPDRRTNEEKGQSIIDMIADNAEGIAALAIIGTLLGLLKLIAKW